MKGQRLSVTRFLAAARDRTRRDRDRFRVRRVREDGEHEEVDLDEIEGRAGTYELVELEPGGEIKTTIGFCEETDRDRKDDGRERDRVLAKETQRLGDSQAHHAALLHSQLERAFAREEELRKRVEHLLDENHKRDLQIGELLVQAEKGASEWLQLAEKAIVTFGTRQFFVELKRRLNQVAPMMTAEQVRLAQELLNSPLFQAENEEEVKLLLATSVTNGAAAS